MLGEESLSVQQEGTGHKLATQDGQGPTSLLCLDPLCLQGQIAQMGLLHSEMHVDVSQKVVQVRHLPHRPGTEVLAI